MPKRAVKRPESFAERVGRERRARKMSVTATARGAGISRQSLINIEAGNQVPKIATVQGLARALGVDVADLMFGNGKGPE